MLKSVPLHSVSVHDNFEVFVSIENIKIHYYYLFIIYLLLLIYGLKNKFTKLSIETVMPFRTPPTSHAPALLLHNN